MTLDKFGRHISKRYKINEIDTKDQQADNVFLKILDHKKYSLDIELNINKIFSDIKSLDEFVKNENELLKDNIEKINQIMKTKIKEVVFFNMKESIKGFRMDIEKLNAIKIEIAESVLNKPPDRRILLSIHHSLNIIIEKLLEEVNKIDEGMGEIDTIHNPTTLKYLNTKIKDTIDDVHKNIDIVKEYLKEEDKTILTKKLKGWNDMYKSSWDNYFIKSVL